MYYYKIRVIVWIARRSEKHMPSAFHTFSKGDYTKAV